MERNNFFCLNQNKESQEKYVQLLQLTASLSRLFTDGPDAYLYYRSMEDIFCKAFKADDFSRSDISVDAGKDGIGIGLKTFLHNNGRTYQKVAEFNSESYLLANLSTVDTVTKVAELRNERLSFTMRAFNLNQMVYHVITRKDNHFSIYEEPMDFIDIGQIRITQDKKTTVHFEDGLHQYNFYKSKSTLLKKFHTENGKEIMGCEVEILEDPYAFLLRARRLNDKRITNTNSNEDVNLKVAEELTTYNVEETYVDSIVLPLYSPKTHFVQERSGLNQWNALGRPRDLNEAYIPFPIWIHRKKPSFFKYSTNDFKTGPFQVELPNGKNLSMRIAQQNGKALMSNPNVALGKWILRDVLQVPPGELITREMLDRIGTDSVLLSKKTDNKYTLDFLKVGSYEEFEQEYN